MSAEQLDGPQLSLLHTLRLPQGSGDVLSLQFGKGGRLACASSSGATLIYTSGSTSAAPEHSHTFLPKDEKIAATSLGHNDADDTVLCACASWFSTAACWRGRARRCTPEHSGVLTHTCACQLRPPAAVTSCCSHVVLHSLMLTLTWFVLFVPDASGIVRRWHVGTSDCLTRMQVNGEVTLTALDSRFDDKQFAVGGGTSLVHVYDAETNTEIKVLGSERAKLAQSRTLVGHTNRLFAIKYHPTDPNLLISAGWDKTVQFWDQRTPSQAVKHIYGPYVCGDALCYNSDATQLLVGSYRRQNSLEVFDVGSGKKMSQLGADAPAHWVYGCAYVPGQPKVTASCGVRENSLRLYGPKGQVVASLENDLGLYAMSCSADGQLLATGGVGGEVLVCSVPTWDTDVLEQA
eukprot:m.120846 g.120846  ORF g.120846 m.120846 type:complete len:405 (+) comp16517_c0_seq11:186-1400(+)